MWAANGYIQPRPSYFHQVHAGVLTRYIAKIVTNGSIIIIHNIMLSTLLYLVSWNPRVETFG